MTLYTGKALSSGNQHYFFTEEKENRSTENGYWKEIGVTKPINKLGIKKYLVFNLDQGSETSWVMEEYHISESESRGRLNHVSDCVNYLFIKREKLQLICINFLTV